MQLGGVDSTAAKVDVTQEIAMKVVKDQLKMQEQMAAALTQPTMVYNADGSVSAVPPQASFDVKM
ncbi:MAG: hypothetical protein ACM3Q4_04320 [Acidobacteriota bacterium]